LALVRETDCWNLTGGGGEEDNEEDEDEEDDHDEEEEIIHQTNENGPACTTA
jgi:hypothetical protein